MNRFLFVLVAFLSLPAPVFAADAVTRLADILARARTMEASFEQTVTGANGSNMQASRGTMMVSRPQLFRWDVRTPFEQLIVADGKQVWVYDPDLAQAIVRPFDQQLSATPALLFSGDAKRIAEHFDVRELEDDGKDARFELTPRAEDALFESLRVDFRGGKLAGMFLVDSLGQRTTITFSKVALNGAIPATRFRFEPPAGTDVIREKE